jgi:hypothetical protein
MTQYAILRVECPEGVVLKLSTIAERIDRVIYLVIIPLERKAFA